MTVRVSPLRYRSGRSDLFKLDRPARKIRIVVDAEILDSGDPSEVTPARLLAGLAIGEHVELWRYADDGPPESAERVSSPWGDVLHAVGWIVAEPEAVPGLSSHSLVWCDGKGVTDGAIGGNIVEYLGRRTDTAAYRDQDPSEAMSRRQADAVLAGAALAIQADMLITNREFLLELGPALVDGVTICTAEEAVQLLSLYLRLFGEYWAWISKEGKVTFTSKLGRLNFYFVGARALVPANWRWAAACVQYDQSNGSDRLTHLVRSVFQRLAQALQARDTLLRALNVTQDIETGDEVVTALDTLVLFLMGAVDATARVAHVVTGHPAGIYEAAWQRRGWVKELQTLAPKLAAVVAPNSVHSDTLTVLRLLRNSVHGEALEHFSGRQSAGGSVETFVHLPRSDARLIADVAKRRGGLSAWGLDATGTGVLTATDPAALIERLVPAVLGLLDAVMAETPVEKLPGVSLSAADAQPPPGENHMFEDRNLRSVRWQLGL